MSDSDDSPPPAKQQKLSSSVTEISSEADSSYVDVETQKALEDIDSCQSDIDTLNEKASEEILMVEMKYNQLRRPHFEKRNNLIRHIPNFWVTAFLNHPRMANIVEEEEEECLHYLKQIDVEEFADIKSGYSIRFLFATNPYFSNNELVKEFHLAPADLSKPQSKSTKIDWKPNMNLTKFIQSKNHKNHRSVGRSFFSWLADSMEPSKDRIAEMVKDDLWPNPLQYYLASDIEVEENGITDSEDDHHVIDDDAVVIVGDDDDDDDLDDDDVYEVKDDDDDDGDSVGEFEETVESIEVDDDDDDDDDAIEVLGSDSEAELLQEQSEISEQDISLTDNTDKVVAVSEEIAEENVDSSLAGEKDTEDSVKLNNESELDNNDGNDSDLLRDDDDDDDGVEGGGAGGGGSGDSDDKNGTENGIKDSEVLKDSEKEVSDEVLKDSEKEVADEVDKAEDGVD